MDEDRKNGLVSSKIGNSGTTAIKTLNERQKKKGCKYLATERITRQDWFHLLNEWITQLRSLPCPRSVSQLLVSENIWTKFCSAETLSLNMDQNLTFGIISATLNIENVKC